jgi:hypothetical protein
VLQESPHKSTKIVATHTISSTAEREGFVREGPSGKTEIATDWAAEIAAWACQREPLANQAMFKP